tara:strand:+ start:269 stop:622 length:354 start_codon:yes stop_codon:yes gene_type:complete
MVMSVEIILGGLMKLGWTGIIPYLIWSYQKDKTKLENTYSKTETEDLFDLKMKPLLVQNENLEKKFDSLMELIKTDRVKREENTGILQCIKTDVALTKNDLSHLKSDVESIKQRLNN